MIVGGTPGTVLYLAGYAFFKDSISSMVLAWDKNSAFSNGIASGVASVGAQHKGVVGVMDGDETILSPWRDATQSLSHGQEFLVHFSSGMLAEAVTCIIYVPVDVVKERMQVQRRFIFSSNNSFVQENATNHQYKGSWNALWQIIRTEGFRGIYRGYGATLASFGPFSALYFVFYEQCKAWSRERIHERNHCNSVLDNGNAKNVRDGDLPLLHLVACSAGAGALASWLTSPLDMAKLRLQVQRGQAAAAMSKKNDLMFVHSIQYRGMLDCLRATYKDGGVQALFRGAGARVFHFAPATTITMTCYEKCRSFYAGTLS